MTDNILVVAAHPDDEILGVAGTCAYYSSRGAKVQAFIVGEGITSRHESRDEKLAEDELLMLQEASRNAAEILGCLPPLFGNYPDNRLDSLCLLDIIKVIEKVILEFNPNIVYTHHIGDLNIDHCIVSKAVHTACRPLPGSKISKLLAFETPSSTEWAPYNRLLFEPNYYVEIGPFLEKKLAALDCYEKEMRVFPHARSKEAILSLARWRGASSGLTAAEAFSVVRQVSRF